MFKDDAAKAATSAKAGRPLFENAEFKNIVALLPFQDVESRLHFAFD